MDSITQLLAGMGNSADAVADTLRTARVRGLRDSPSFFNPIVRYLNQTLDIGGRMEIGTSGTALRLQLMGKVSEVALPAAVQAFLDAFHRGLYPDLEASEAR